MPIHDWAGVDDYLFHDFQLSWVVELCRRLNADVLPSSYFAMSETLELRPPLNFVVLPEPDRSGPLPSFQGGQSADECPPRTRLTVKRGRIEYASRVITVRDQDTHVVAAAILFVSQQDKQIGYRWQSFLCHVVAALSHGIHLLVVDLFPPGKSDPHGIHKEIWDQFEEGDPELPADKPLTLVSYDAGREYVAYVEFVGVGDKLPEMPLFLQPEIYVLAPLEATYQAAWREFPDPLKGLLESPNSL